MAKTGIGSTAGNTESVGTTEAPTNAPIETAKAPERKGPEKVTGKHVAAELLAIARRPCSQANASEAKRCAGMLHRVHGSTPAAVKEAVGAYYNDASEKNAKALADAVAAEKFDG